MHLVPFGCLTKLGAKRAEVVQKFVPWSRAVIFHNKQLDPPHWTLTSCFGAFRTIWVHLGQFGCITTLSAKSANLVQKFVPRSRVGIFVTNAPNPLHWTLNSCFGVYCTSWMHSGLFGCLTKLSAKRAEVGQKFVPWSRVRIFRNERTRSTLLDPKLKFCYVSYYLGAFGTVWLPYETWSKMGRTSAKVRAMKSCQNFSQETQPIHHIGP